MNHTASVDPGYCPAAAWIDTPEALEAWLAAVDDGDVLGMDTEFTRRNTFHAQLSLLQLGHRGRHALVDPLAFDLGDILQRHIGQRPLTCVMHSAGEDIETLAPWLPQGPATLFDTQLAAAFAGLELGLGYRALVERFCGISLDKGETRSDWNRRPLTDSQKRYATLDVVYLEDLHRILAGKMRQRNHETWFRADCERLRRRTDVDNLPGQPQRALSAAADWPREQQALLRRLLLWRERRARELDKPRNWLIDNPQALDLASHPPADMDQLMQATRGQRALRGAQRKELLELLHHPVAPEEVAATEAIPARPDHAARQAVRDMKVAVDKRAAELDLPAGLLCPRKALEALFASGQWPPLLEGWRHEQLQPVLQPWLPA